MKNIEKKNEIKCAAYFDAVPTKGRPLKKLNEAGAQLVQDLAGVMCTEEEIACVLGTTVEVLHNKVNNETFVERVKNGKESGKASLRRYQFELAKRNPSMAIWLGKQYLGQKEVQETEKDENNNIHVTLSVKDVSGGDNAER